MSDCRFGVSPVNYPDPDPESLEPDISACTLLFLQYFKTCSQEGSPELYLHPGSTQALVLLHISAMT